MCIRDRVLVGRLGKADARIQHDTVAVHAGGLGSLHAGRQEAAHLIQHIVVVGQGLHVRRLAPHVHQAQPGLRVGRHGGHGARSLQGPNIVDDVSPQGQCFAHDHRFAGVHRDRHAQAQGLAQHRQNPGQLVRRTQ